MQLQSHLHHPRSTPLVVAEKIRPQAAATKTRPPLSNRWPQQQQQAKATPSESRPPRLAATCHCTLIFL